MMESNSSDFVCCVCGDHFQNEQQYFGHLQIHSGEVVWRCSQCDNPNVTFESQSKLKAHENVHHNLVKPFKCTKCDLVFERASHLDYHTRSVHMGEKSQVCQICGKGFFRKFDLKTHLNVHLGTNQCICEICGRKFNHVSNLIRHCRTHAGLKPYPCSICGKRFNQVNSLARHKNIHEREDVTDDNKGKLITENQTVEQKKIVKRRHYCKICGESFQFVILLRQHEKIHEKTIEVSRAQDVLQQHDFDMEAITQHCDIELKNIKLREKIFHINEDIETDRDESINISDILSSYNCDEIELAQSDTIQRDDTYKRQMQSDTLIKELNNKCLTIDGSQYFIKVCESDYLKMLGVHSLELQENGNIALLQENHDNSDVRETIPMAIEIINEDDTKKDNEITENDRSTLVVKQTNTQELLYELEVSNLSQNNFNPKLCNVNDDKTLHERWDLNSHHCPTDLMNFNETINQQNVNFELNHSKNPQMTEDFHSDVMNQHTEVFDNYSEVTENQQDNHQTPMVRLVQNEEGEQFFELIREPLEFNITKESYNMHDQHLTTQECDESMKKIDESIVKDCKKPKVTREKSRVKECKQKFQCTVCKKEFSSKNLKQHIGTHFTDQQKFQCKQCGLSFAWKSTLNKHIASNHRPDGPLKFVCEICPKVYKTLSQVNEHVRRDHLKERKHVCSDCGKCFFKSFDLKSHVRTHTDERPYVCQACGKSFHHQSQHIRHERTHSGERPYSCDFCDRTFTQARSLKAHNLKAHKQRHQDVTKVDLLDYRIDEDDPIALNVT